MFNNLKIFAVTTICQVFAKKEEFVVEEEEGKG
jgi:hypothetical protein